MAQSEARRASGALASEEEAARVAKDGEEPAGIKESTDPSRPPQGEVKGHDLFRNPGFSRMRMDWRSEDGVLMRSALRTVDDRIVELFADAFSLMHEIFEIVRTPETNEDGEALVDRHGFPQWKRTPAGGWEEDWTRLSPRQREQFLFQITTRLFDWDMRAADVWGEAMFARGQWEERFAIEYDRPKSGTIEDRTAVGRIGSAEERYFALFVSLFSRKADAITRNMSLLGQRLKDVLIG